MELHGIILRTVAAWLLLTVLLRLSGKESVSQLSGRTLVLTLVLSDLIDDMAFAEAPVAGFVVAAGTVVLVHMLVSFMATLSDRAYALVEGEHPVIMRQGHMLKRGLRWQRISANELDELLRVQGFDRSRWVEIEEARVEREGKISTLRRRWAEHLRRRNVSKGKARG